MMGGIFGLFYLSLTLVLAMPKGTLTFSGGKKITVEVAQTQEEKSRGLMFRTRLDKDTGMLFVFSEEQRLSFWMKNTYIPLTIGFFNKKRKLLETQDMLPPLGPISDGQLKNYASASPALYALEMERGWFTQNKIKIGETFKLRMH